MTFLIKVVLCPKGTPGGGSLGGCMPIPAAHSLCTSSSERPENCNPSSATAFNSHHAASLELFAASVGSRTGIDAGSSTSSSSYSRHPQQHNFESIRIVAPTWVSFSDGLPRKHARNRPRILSMSGQFAFQDSKKLFTLLDVLVAQSLKKGALVIVLVLVEKVLVHNVSVGCDGHPLHMDEIVRETQHHFQVLVCHGIVQDCTHCQCVLESKLSSLEVLGCLSPGEHVSPWGAVVRRCC